MTCDSETNVYVGELLMDSFGGSVRMEDIASNLGSIFVTINTPWGEEDSYVKIYKGETKTYTEGEKTYSVRCVNVGDVGPGVGRVQVCYEFVEKLNTTLAMNYDESSNLVEGGTVKFDLVLKDQNGVALMYNVDIYVNGVFERYVSGDAHYSHLITAGELDSTLTFQAKFKGLGVYNPCESSVKSVEVAGKVATNLSITADKTVVEIDETITFRGTLKKEDGSVVPNKTVTLQYKTVDGTYDEVLRDGFPIVASTDIEGKYYRPFEPTADYLDVSTYAMYFAGDNVYKPSRSTDIVFDVVEACPIPTITGIKKE